MPSQTTTFFRHSGGEARKQLGSHGSHTQKLPAHLKTSCSCKMGSVTIPCQPYDGLWCFCTIEQVTITIVNDCRKQLFTRKSRILENLPPTKAALQQHVKRANYQAICWTQAPKPPKTGAERNILC